MFHVLGYTVEERRGITTQLVSGVKVVIQIMQKCDRSSDVAMPKLALNKGFEGQLSLETAAAATARQRLSFGSAANLG